MSQSSSNSRFPLAPRRLNSAEIAATTAVLRLFLLVGEGSVATFAAGMAGKDDMVSICGTEMSFGKHTKNLFLDFLHQPQSRKPISSLVTDKKCIHGCVLSVLTNLKRLVTLT